MDEKRDVLWVREGKGYLGVRVGIRVRVLGRVRISGGGIQEGGR